MIKNGLVPNIEHSVAIDYGFEPVRAECTEGDREKAKCRGNSTKCDHFLCYLQRHFTSAKVLISFASAYSRNGKARFPLLRDPTPKRWRQDIFGRGEVARCQTIYALLILRLASA